MYNPEQAYKVGSAAVKLRLAEQRPEILATLKSLKKKDVAVMTGVHDHVQNVFQALGLPFELSPSISKNMTAKIIFANCGWRPGSVRLLEQAVSAGRTLVSSDWALEVIQRSFPETIARGPGSSGDEVVSVEADVDSLWDDVIVPGANPQWWLEGASYPIKILNEDKVQVIAASSELLQKYKSEVVAAAFDWNQGHVFHVISHFWSRRSRAITESHKKPATDFLERGMGLSAESIARLGTEHPQLKRMTFSDIQTAATSTELIAQLTARAIN